MSGTVQCSCRARDFHPICAYLPSNPTAINSTTPGTYTSRLRLLKMASSEGSVVSTSWVLTTSPRNLGQHPGHGQQHHNAGHYRGPPINADPPQPFAPVWRTLSGCVIGSIFLGHRDLLDADSLADADCRPAHRTRDWLRLIDIRRAALVGVGAPEVLHCAADTVIQLHLRAPAQNPFG
jgi:hypothetical protein